MTSISGAPSSILVHEHVTGGGRPGGALPPMLAREASAILRAVVEDLRAWGEPFVVTTRDPRVEAPQPDADRVVDVESEVYPTAVRRLAHECAATLLIAPEGDAAAARLAEQLAGDGVVLIGSPPEAAAAAADKWACRLRWRDAGLPAPRSECVPAEECAATAGRIGYPVVVKPRSGAGCAGVALAAAPEDLAAAVAQASAADGTGILVQEYVAETPASVSLLVSSGGSLALSLNEQRVTAGVPFAYRGGVASVAHPRRDEALALARRAVELEPGLRGYVGVDLILGGHGCRLVEVNPRITTSYVGLRRVSPVNLARLVCEACLQDRLPAEAPVLRPSPFDLDGEV